MVDQKLVNYIKTGLWKGIPLEQIRRRLLAAGWPEHEINEAINFAQQRNFQTTEPALSVYGGTSKKSSRSEGLKILLIVTLVFVLIASIGAIVVFYALGAYDPQVQRQVFGGQGKAAGFIFITEKPQWTYSSDGNVTIVWQNFENTNAEPTIRIQDFKVIDCTDIFVNDILITQATNQDIRSSKTQVAVRQGEKLEVKAQCTPLPARTQYSLDARITYINTEALTGFTTTGSLSGQIK